MASRGSKGLERPRQFAVAGMNCATPCAPARLTAVGSNRLSCQISRAKKSVGRSFCAAADASALQIVSVDTGCDGVSRPSAAPISSGSAALACSVRPTALKRETNRARTTAGPARLHMFLPGQRPLRVRIITGPLPSFHFQSGQEADDWCCVLLDASRKRPRGRRAAHKRDELAPSHRLTLKPRVDILPHSVNLSVVHHSKIGHRLAAMGHKQTKRPAWTLSALPPKADIRSAR